MSTVSCRFVDLFFRIAHREQKMTLKFGDGLVYGDDPIVWSGARDSLESGTVKYACVARK